MNFPSYLIGIGLFIAGAIFVAVDAVSHKLEVIADQFKRHLSLQSEEGGPNTSFNPSPDTPFRSRPISLEGPWLKGETKPLIEEAQRLGLIVQVESEKAIIRDSKGSNSFAYNENEFVSRLRREIESKKKTVAVKEAANGQQL